MVVYLKNIKFYKCRKTRTVPSFTEKKGRDISNKKKKEHRKENKGREESTSKPLYFLWSNLNPLHFISATHTTNVSYCSCSCSFFSFVLSFFCVFPLHTFIQKSSNSSTKFLFFIFQSFKFFSIFIKITPLQWPIIIFATISYYFALFFTVQPFLTQLIFTHKIKNLFYCSNHYCMTQAKV